MRACGNSYVRAYVVEELCGDLGDHRNFDESDERNVCLVDFVPQNDGEIVWVDDDICVDIVASQGVVYARDGEGFSQTKIVNAYEVTTDRGGFEEIDFDDLVGDDEDRHEQLKRIHGKSDEEKHEGEE